VLQYDKEKNNTASNGNYRVSKKEERREWQHKNIKPSAQLL
jgi:hypothetical protein